jgi:hypothetical protein
MAFVIHLLLISDSLVSGFIQSAAAGKQGLGLENDRCEPCYTCLSGRWIIEAGSSMHPLRSTPDDQDEKLSKLGYSSRERKSSSRDPVENEAVNVNLVENIDAVTLTAIGFGLVAFNFFILANVGDAGLGGIIASIINISRQ